MRRSYYSILLFLIALLILMPAIGQAHDLAPSQQQDGTWKGHVSNQQQAFIKIVETPKEWSDLWLRAFEGPAPEIDFEKNVVACVFLGYGADWLYSIHIGEPARRGETWVVPYGLAEMVLELAGPFKAGGQYAMKILEKKKDAPMLLEHDALSRRAR